MAASRSTRITILLVIDIIFFFVELISGYAVGSLALVADSFHMLNDVLSLIVALYAIKLTSNNATEQYSYGWHRAEILGALVNGVFLLALCCSIFMESIERFVKVPEISNPKIIMIVGGCGLLSNIVGLLLFHEHSHSHDKSKPELEAQPDPTLVEDVSYVHPAQTRAQIVQAAQDIGSSQLSRSPSAHRRSRHMSGGNKDTLSPISTRSDAIVDVEEVTPPSVPQVQRTTPAANGHSHGPGQGGSMNMRALILHVMGDALGNVGVILTGLVILLAHGKWRFYFDPSISLVIAAIIFTSALPLVKSTSLILLQGVPSHVSLNDVRQSISGVAGVLSVHELHVWQLSETKVVASVHVQIERHANYMDITSEIRRVLHEHGIHSATVQPEYGATTEEHQRAMEVMGCLVPCPPDSVCNENNVCCPPKTRPPTRPPSPKAQTTSTQV